MNTIKCSIRVFIVVRRVFGLSFDTFRRLVFSNRSDLKPIFALRSVFSLELLWILFCGFCRTRITFDGKAALLRPLRADIFKELCKINRLVIISFKLQVKDNDD